MTGCRAVFGCLRARREGWGEGKGLGKAGHLHALWSECGCLAARPGAWAPASCPVLSCLAVSSLGHFIRRLEERVIQTAGSRDLKISETPTISCLRGFFFFPS